MKIKNWKTELRPCGIFDPQTGEALFVAAKIRPAWYWRLRRVRLFLSIVWRVADTDHLGRKYRLGFALAWTVSAVALGPTE